MQNKFIIMLSVTKQNIELSYICSDTKQTHLKRKDIYARKLDLRDTFLLKKI